MEIIPYTLSCKEAVLDLLAETVAAFPQGKGLFAMTASMSSLFSPQDRCDSMVPIKHLRF